VFVGMCIDTSQAPLNIMDLNIVSIKSILRWEKKGIMEYTHATTYNSVYRCTIANWLRRKTLKVNS